MHQFFERDLTIAFYLRHITDGSKYQYNAVQKGLIPAVTKVIRTDCIFSLSVTSSEGLPWAVQAFAGRQRGGGGGEASIPSALIIPSEREELLCVAQDGSFAQPSPRHRACDRCRAEAPSDGAQSFSFLHTAVTATIWKSKDFLEVG